VGVASNIFGAGFPHKHVPSFSWGGADGFAVHEFDKAVATARKVMERRHVPLTDLDEAILRSVSRLDQRMD
jgi:hypothetical protein